jgi:HEAT repeat protein
MEDLWDELIHQGDVSRASLERVPELVTALEQGADDPADLLYLLAALCVGKPERLAEQIRVAAGRGAPAYAKLLDHEEAEVCAAALSALVAVDAADVEQVARLADDPDPLVRATTALALGVLGARLVFVERLLEDEDVTVRYAAALALQKLARIDARVVHTLVRTALDEESSVATDRPPWDSLYPLPDEAALSLAPELVELEVPFLLDEVGTAEGPRALVAVDLLLQLAFDKRVRSAASLSPLQRRVLERLAAGSKAWRWYAQMESWLGVHGLPTKRADLQRWLKRA